MEPDENFDSEGRKEGNGDGKAQRAPRRSRLELLSTDEYDSLPSRRSRYSATPSPSPHPSPSPSPSSARRQKQGTSSRPSHYILGHAPPSLTQAKLPKNGPVLARLISKITEKKPSKYHVTDATREMVSEIKEVWSIHFPTALIFGDGGGEMIKSDRKIAEKLRNLYREWNQLEIDSRTSKSNQKGFLEKKKNFVEKMDMPLDIRLQNYKEILKSSGILDWEEDVNYLDGQMTKEQPGTFGSVDKRQKKCDQRREAQKERERLEAEKAETREERGEEEEEEEEEVEEEEESPDESDLDVNDNDYVFVAKTKKPPKKDVMSHISQAADAQNLSVRKRIKVASSTLNAAGVDLDSTNVSRSTAWRIGQKQRLKKAKEIRDEFVLPNKLIIHWDGKMLRLRGRVMSNRVCVYISGVDRELRKLLGIPEAKDGSGASEFHIVKEALDKWMVNEQIVGMVFDTTATNTGREKGCCR